MSGPVCVFEATRLVDAQLACARLCAGGFLAEVLNETTATNFGGILPGVTSIRVVVPESQAQEAREWLADLPAEEL